MSEDTFGSFLKRQFHLWVGKEIGKSGQIPSQAEFARWLDIPTSSLSVWMNDYRLPTGESVDKLADKLGVEVYDRLGLARKMPRNKKLYYLAEIWSKLPEEKQDELYHLGRDFAEQEEQDKQNHGHSSQFDANAA